MLIRWGLTVVVFALVGAPATARQIEELVL